MRPTTVLAGSDHYFHTECPSVRPSQNCKADRDCGLAEWIIDDSCLVWLEFGSYFSILSVPVLKMFLS